MTFEINLPFIVLTHEMQNSKCKMRYFLQK